MLLADENMKRGNFPEAERVDALGRALEPNYWDIFVQSAVVAGKLGKAREAEAILHRAMVICPSMSDRRTAATSCIRSIPNWTMHDLRPRPDCAP